MQVLLPPSETKRVGGVGSLDTLALSHHSVLGAARARVRSSLELLCADVDEAARTLKLGVKARAELAHNLALGSSGTLPAIERYTGVLFDALDALSLDGASRGWVDRHVSVQSALFGLVGAGDLIPAYRLSAGSRLPSLGSSLKTVWREAHVDGVWDHSDWILDLRSKDYVELAPLPAGAGMHLAVAQRGAGGQVRALNHFNKAAKGDLVRRLAHDNVEISGARDLVEWARSAGLEMTVDDATGHLTLVTSLGAPGAAAAEQRSVRRAG